MQEKRKDIFVEETRTAEQSRNPKISYWTQMNTDKHRSESA
jgi:hypothetical protein